MSRENLGARFVDEVTVDVTSLDSAGTEPYSTFTGQSGIDDPDSVQVIDQEDPRRHVFPDNGNEQLRVVDAGPVQNQKSDDPDSQTYTANEETILSTYDAGGAGSIQPINFNPADPTDAGLTVILRAEYHDGTTTDLASVADGTEQSFENLVDAVATGDDGKAIRKLIVIIDNTTGSDITEDVGATTTEFIAYNQDTPNNTDIGEVTVRLEGRR